MKKFIVAVCCALLACTSAVAQEAETKAPATPVEDVAAAPVAAEASVVAPVAATPAPIYGAQYGTVINSGCNNCGSNIVAAPMTYTAAPIQSSCCGQTVPMTYTAAPVQTACCGQAAPVMAAAPVAVAAPAASACCPAPVDPCCNTGRQQRVRGMLTSVRSRFGSRRGGCCDPCCN